MKIPSNSAVFLSKAVECYLAEAGRHKVRIEQSDCLECFVDLNAEVHRLTGNALKRVHAQMSLVPVCNVTESGL